MWDNDSWPQNYFNVNTPRSNVIERKIYVKMTGIAFK